MQESRLRKYKSYFLLKLVLDTIEVKLYLLPRKTKSIFGLIITRITEHDKVNKLQNLSWILINAVAIHSKAIETLQNNSSLRS